MILKRKRLKYERGLVGNEIFMFTANSTIRSNGNLVMGSGCARTVRDFYKGIDKTLGKCINHLDIFGVKFVQHGEQFIGAFQTKINWQDSSPLDLVETSIGMLKQVAKKRPNHTFHLPCPAVNHGGQTVEDVLPMLDKLPDNVIIYLDE